MLRPFRPRPTLPAATPLVLLVMPLFAGTLLAAETEAPAPLPQPAGYIGYTGMPPVQPGYPYLNAPLYPCPLPNIPAQVGSTLVTNQAFYPQEMLYPHDYDAIYPPFYHQVKGRWLRTPLGTKSDEKWELLGTRVKVRYRSSIPFWTGFHVPNGDYFDYDRNWANNPSGRTHYTGNRYH